MIILKRSIPPICRYYLCPSVIDPDFGLSHIKVKTSNWLQRQKNPADTFVFNNAVVGSTMLRYITDPKVSLSASGQCYRLSWVCSLINENVHYMHTEKWLQHLQEDRQPQAFCGFWQLGAMNVCCLFFFLNHSVKWTHSANEGKKKGKKTLLPAGVRKIKSISEIVLVAKRQFPGFWCWWVHSLHSSFPSLDS